MAIFRGSYVVNITPMTPDQELDEKGLRDNIDWYVKKGTAGICCVGSTGEFVSLTREERLRVAAIAVEQTAGRVPVLVGTAHETTRETIAYTRHAREIGADGVLIINPYYCKPSADEIYSHFRAICDAVDIPIMLYNNPHDSGIDLSDELMIRICSLKNIQYIKEASGEIRRVRNLLRLSDNRVQIFCGSDDLIYESFMMGAVGFISVCGNVVPDLSQQIFDLIQEEKYGPARELYFKILPLCDLIERSGKKVQMVKAAVNKIGHAAGPCRLPRLPLTPPEDAALDRVLKTMGLL